MTAPLAAHAVAEWLLLFPLLAACLQVPTRRLAAGATAQSSATLSRLRAGIVYEVNNKCCNVKGGSVPFNVFLVS